LTQFSSIIFCLYCNSVAAHHAFAVDVDISKVGAIEGVFWRNLNAHYFARVSREGEFTEMWDAETYNLMMLKGVGWEKDTAVIGEVVKFNGV